MACRLSTKSESTIKVMAVKIAYRFTQVVPLWRPHYTNKRIKRTQDSTAMEEKEMNTYWKRSKTVPICRWHDTIHRKSWGYYQKTTRAHQWTQSSCRIQNKYTEIHYISRCSQWNFRNKETHIKKNRIPRNKLNCKRPVLRKLLRCW